MGSLSFVTYISALRDCCGTYNRYNIVKGNICSTTFPDWKCAYWNGEGRHWNIETIIFRNDKLKSRWSYGYDWLNIYGQIRKFRAIRGELDDEIVLVLYFILVSQTRKVCIIYTGYVGYIIHL